MRHHKAIAAAIALLLAVTAGAARADDRDLLKETFGEPYVFILFDTSGSMHWSTRCTAAQQAAGECRQVCTDRDCFVPLNGDDPASKFYQSKEALYQVLEQVEGVQFGFGSFNQDQLRVRSKHWLYKAREAGVDIGASGPFPKPGSQEVFGRLWNCDNGAQDARIGCDSNNPADLDDPWEVTRVQRLPKGSEKLNQTVRFFVRTGGTVYRVSYRPNSAESLGSAEIHVEVTVERCDNNNCGNRTLVGVKEVHFDQVDQFVSWDNQVSRTQPQEGYFTQGNAADPQGDNFCSGWDPNNDSASDAFDGYSLRFPTTQHSNPDLRPFMDSGDVVPLSWDDDNKQEILFRLAPNTRVGGAPPDFGVARYFENLPRGGDQYLRLQSENVRPLVAHGATPLGFSLAKFREWWAGCQQGSCPNDTGWSDLAAARDPDWACRRKYLLVITDGDDTCPGRDPCSFTAALFAQEAIKTFVVGFGVENTAGNRLHCMAANGGSGDPILPQNKQQLVDALTAIFGEIQEEARSFASAAVPSVQAEVEDKIYLSSFTPLNNESIWDGHLDAFLKPLPLTDDNRPDKSPEARCSTTKLSRCHLWDAAEVLETQAPTADDIASGVLKLGPGTNQRRVFFPRALDLMDEAVPRKRALLRTPDHTGFTDSFSDSMGSDENAWKDLFDGLGVFYTVADLSLPTSLSLPKQVGNQVVEETLVLKSSVLDNPDGSTEDIDYVLGDIFHANPVVVDRPNDFRAFAGNYYTDGSDADGVTCLDSNPGYRCFAKKHERRRKLLAVGANDAQLHLFDIGIFSPSTEKFSNGGGKEVMAFIPRLALPIVRDLARGSTQIFGLDGTARVTDVFIDPVHVNRQPTPADRRWRTVLISGLREGGDKDSGGRVQLGNGKPFTSGYFALDLTQPDAYETNGDPINENIVPSCITGYTTGECGPVRFGDELWEFTDSINGSPAEWGVAYDQDVNGAPDLGDTWSVPVIGRVRVLNDSGELEDRFVAIFGGGFDPENRASPRRGTWLYIVDVETGRAIYKRRLEGAAAASPAAVDRNRDGYIDWVYQGTTAGFLYKVDISTPVSLETVTLRLLDGTTRNVKRVTDEAWNPFKIFTTGGRPLFFPPTVLSVAAINRFALAFGSGDREQLWNLDGSAGRFYMIVDEGFTRTTTGLPRDETAYTAFGSESGTNQGADFVLNPPNGRDRGWVMTLDTDERVVAQAFSVAGVTIFPTFKPQVIVSGDNTGGGGRNEEPAVCARTGDSRVFVMFSHNGDPILPSEIGGATPDSRYMLVGEALVTPPFADRSTTKNPDDDTPPDPDQKQWEDAIRKTLEGLFPPRTRFANYTIDVSFIRSDTGLVGPIPIPVGILEKNWKEF